MSRTNIKLRMTHNGLLVDQYGRIMEYDKEERERIRKNKHKYVLPVAYKGAHL
jgi:hypothetical protein